MDARAMARHFAESMIGHRNSLAGKAEDAVKAQYALHRTATALTDQAEDQGKAARTVLEHWKGDNSEGFERRSARLGRQLRTTADAARDAEKVVAGVTSALTTGHARARLAVDEYLDKAAGLLDTGLKVGTRAALLKAVGQAADLEPRYTKETAEAVRHARGELEDAARRLRALEKDVEHEGVADGRAERTRGGAGGRTRPSNARGKGRSRTIVSAARRELGTRESPPGSNRNPYGPTAAWCSSFATSMWRKAGVDIPVLPFTGDVFRWGQRNGKAYRSLSAVRPGDVLLFGTGPSSPATSRHIGIVEKVSGGTVTLIEGNSGDAVRRNTHELSPATFYGGVHP
ncbi:CHAP domain-containing protein [Saccharothrix longispora]|uniref:CHAP domain-containing protein n=1 Tax=Saccharothrix longispora TaxID=33920 RepID=UPI0028FD8B17|nr:CHAP domain-containing protein [Saccharothrix longispora]MBY8848907.1 CHAP domain-containing protein [Saccharothrix sp. MB29]MDU0288084.1 CHAP domain-containing protein [Saccharothrix longispora]